MKLHFSLYCTLIAALLVAVPGFSQLPVNKQEIPALQDVSPYSKKAGISTRATKKAKKRKANKKQNRQKIGFSLSFGGGSPLSLQSASGSLPVNLPAVTLSGGAGAPTENAQQILQPNTPLTTEAASLSVQERSELQAEVHYGFRVVGNSQHKNWQGLWLKTGFGWQQGRSQYAGNNSSIAEHSLNVRSQGPRGSLALSTPLAFGSFGISPGVSYAVSRLNSTASLYATEGQARLSSEADLDSTLRTQLRPEITVSYKFKRFEIEALAGYAISSEAAKEASFTSASQTGGQGTPLLSLQNQDLSWKLGEEKSKMMHWGLGLKVSI